MLYSIGDSNPSTLYNDVVIGNNKGCSSTVCTSGFSAGTGWDPVTGTGWDPVVSIFPFFSESYLLF